MFNILNLVVINILNINFLYIFIFYLIIFLHFLYFIYLFFLFKNELYFLFKNLFISFILTLFFYIIVYYYKYYILIIFLNSFKEIIHFLILLIKKIKKEYYIINAPKFYNLSVLNKLENIFLKRGSYIIFIQFYYFFNKEYKNYFFINIIILFIIILLEIHFIYFIFFICILKNFFKKNFLFSFICDLEKFLLSKINNIEDYRIILDNSGIWTNGYYSLNILLKNNPDLIYLSNDPIFWKWFENYISFSKLGKFWSYSPNDYWNSHIALISKNYFSLVRTHNKKIDFFMYEYKGNIEYWTFSKFPELEFLEDFSSNRDNYCIYNIAFNYLKKKKELNEKIKFLENYSNKPAEYKEESVQTFLNTNKLIINNDFEFINYNEVSAYFLTKYSNLKQDELNLFIKNLYENKFTHFDVIKIIKNLDN